MDCQWARKVDLRLTALKDTDPPLFSPDPHHKVSAVQSALNGFCKVLLSNHIKTCVVEDIRNGNEETAVAELCETIKKMM